MQHPCHPRGGKVGLLHGGLTHQYEFVGGIGVWVLGGGVIEGGDIMEATHFARLANKRCLWKVGNTMHKATILLAVFCSPSKLTAAVQSFWKDIPVG